MSHRSRAFLRASFAAIALALSACAVTPGPPKADGDTLAAFIEGCGATLAARDAEDPARRADLLARAAVPDDYDDVARVPGLYPLTRVPFAAGVRL